MKKILGIFIILIFSVSISLGAGGNGNSTEYDNEEGSNDEYQGGNQGGGYGGNGTNGTAGANGVATNTPSGNNGTAGGNNNTTTPSSGSNQTTEAPTVECSEKNCDGICQDNVCIRNDYGDLGIHVTTGCLLNGQCSMNIYDTIGIRQKDPNPDVKTFAQDIVLGATMFFGTVMTVLIIVSGLSYVMAGFSGKSPDKAKKMLIGSIVGLLFVTLSYTIIRLIQFLATGGS